MNIKLVEISCMNNSSDQINVSLTLLQKCVLLIFNIHLTVKSRRGRKDFRVQINISKIDSYFEVKFDIGERKEKESITKAPRLL